MDNEGIIASEESLVGSLIGLMAGDALGLPFEGVKPKRIQKWISLPLEHRLIMGKGMISDDSEHAILVASAMIRCWEKPEQFSKDLAWRLRWWLARVPAGTGMATARALIKLWLGFSPYKSGVFSAGNGPAMRAPIIGVARGHEPERMRSWLRNSTCLTHSDPKAMVGALAVGHAAYLASISESVNPDLFYNSIVELLAPEDPKSVNEFLLILKQLLIHLEAGDSVRDVAQALGLEQGVTGYMYHTVPIVLYVWMQQKSFEEGMEDIIALGGDTDTTAAIFGGISGAQHRKADIPASWVENIADYPLNPHYAENLARQLHRKRSGEAVRVPRLNGPVLVVRNIFFLMIVLGHGFRRLLPPY